MLSNKRHIILPAFLFLLLLYFTSLSAKAQNVFTKTDFDHLTTATLLAVKYKMDSIVYEHGFRAYNNKELAKPYFFLYEHSYQDGVLLTIRYEKEVELLSILVFTGDYNYYRGLRNTLTEDWEVEKTDVDFYGYNSKIVSAPMGKYIDGIRTDENMYLIGWAMKINDWDAVYDNNF